MVNISTSSARGQHTDLHYSDPLAHAGETEAEGGRLTAPMPGKIVAVVAKKPGSQVKRAADHGSHENGTHDLRATRWRDRRVLYAVGDQVSEAQLLAFAQSN
jgi:3-methylcrotonyl-CoA carboxylase alpha subunit